MSEPMPEGSGGQTPPPPRTTEGTPARPGSMYPGVVEKETGAPELPATAGLSGSEYIPYQADIRRIGAAGGRPMGGPGETVYTALQRFKTMKYTDPNAYNDIVNNMRQSGIIGPNVVSDVSIADAYEVVLKASAELAEDGIFKEPDLLIKEVGDFNQTGQVPGVRGVGPGAYAGPRETVTMASERDLRAAVDAMASQVLGRAATEDEFQNALKQVRSAEQAEPTITTTGPGRTVTQGGLTAEGRSSIIQEALMQGPEAEEFGKATKMMDLFYSALEARPSGA